MILMKLRYPMRIKARYERWHAYEGKIQLHLQWFASAEEEGRTEDPTEQKIRKAREEGKVAKSAELTGAFVLLFPIITLALLSTYIFELMQEMLVFFFKNSTSIDITTNASLYLVFLGYFSRMVLPIAIIAVISAVAGSLMQVGFLFSTKPITPDFKKIAPDFPKFFKRSFMSAEAGFNLLKSVVKVLIIGLLAFFNIRTELDRIINFVGAPFYQSFGLIALIGFRILISAALLMLGFSVFDYVFQKKQHVESLKMSKQEIKEERKESDGDPMIKHRLQQQMRQILNNRMMQSIPDADVIVTNPTHFAVALEYDPSKMNSPMLIAKGQDHLALKIKELGAEHNIPIIENKPLARGLYADLEIGDEVPVQYYEILALVFKQVAQMTGKYQSMVG